MSSVTVKDLDLLIGKLAKKEDEYEKAKAQATEIFKEKNRLEYQVVAHLKDLGRDSYDSPLGKAKIVEKWRINLPKEELAKKELFDHLRERGIFDALATVNSNTLNSLYMKDWAAAKERGEGVTFFMPGVGAPIPNESLNFKQKKQGEQHGSTDDGFDQET